MIASKFFKIYKYYKDYRRYEFIINDIKIDD